MASQKRPFQRVAIIATALAAAGLGAGPKPAAAQDTGWQYVPLGEDAANGASCNDQVTSRDTGDPIATIPGQVVHGQNGQPFCAVPADQVAAANAAAAQVYTPPPTVFVQPYLGGGWLGGRDGRNWGGDGGHHWRGNNGNQGGWQGAPPNRGNWQPQPRPGTQGGGYRMQQNGGQHQAPAQAAGPRPGSGQQWHRP